MALDRLEQRVRKALGHPMFNELKAIVPQSDWSDPARLSGWLTAAALEDPKGARRQGFLEADAALRELNGARDLQDRISRVFHDPKLRAEVGIERIEQALRDPESAYKELIQRSAAGQAVAIAQRCAEHARRGAGIRLRERGGMDRSAAAADPERQHGA